MAGSTRSYPVSGERSSSVPGQNTPNARQNPPPNFSNHFDRFHANTQSRLKDGAGVQEQVESIEEHQGRLKPGHSSKEGEKTKEAIRSIEKSLQKLKNKLKKYDPRDWVDEEE